MRIMNLEGPAYQPGWSSVLVLKPDGVASGVARQDLLALIEQHELSIVLAYGTVFRDEDVEDLWPKLSRSGRYPIAAEMNVLYMTSGPSEVYAVTGASAVERCVQIRTSMRAVFGTSGVRNCVHTPSEPHEVEPNWRKLAHDLPSRHRHARGKDDAVTEGAWGRLAAVPPGLRAAGARSVWDRIVRAEALEPPLDDGPTSLVLRPGDPQSIDYGVSVLMELRRDWTVSDAIAAYFTAELTGAAVIMRGERDVVAQRADEIRARHRLNVSIEPPRLVAIEGVVRA